MIAFAPLPSLARIVTVARAGSLALAEQLFAEGGFDQARDNPAALAVAGRLAKDRALRAAPALRPALYRQAAAAYAAAAALDPQPYTRINQATLTWLAGDRASGQTLARALLDWLDSGVRPAETPYWLAATRAEAHLLLGDLALAGQWLAKAVALQSDALEDRATTLRQLGLILAADEADPAWLEPYRLGRIVQFGGHLGVAGAAAAALSAQVAAVLETHRAVAGFGALAAGADLIVAEALLARGAELHVVLPTPPEVFAAQSVVPYGADWAERFEAALDAATSLRWTSSLAGAYQPEANRLSADVAMGAARLQALRLDTGALQILVCDSPDAGPGGNYGAGMATAYLGQRWRPDLDAAEPQQVCLYAPRTGAVVASGHKAPEGRPNLRLAALLHVGFTGLTGLDDGALGDEIDGLVGPLRRQAAQLAVAPDLLLPADTGHVAVFFDADRAWHHATSLLALPEGQGRLCVTGHYGLVHALEAIGTSPAGVAGQALTTLDRLTAGALPGVLVASEALAAAICVRRGDMVSAEEIGECDDDPIYALLGRGH